MRCEGFAEALAAAGDDRLSGPERDRVMDEVTRRHVESCLRCQADLVQYRRILRAAHQLRTQRLEPSPGLLTDILARVEEAGERHAIRSLLHGRRGAYLAAATAATAAGAAGALVLATRSRRRLPLAG